jgi:hypothetical protein
VSPRVIDERWIKHERSLAADSAPPPPRGDLPQFSLRELFGFVTGIIVCISLVATAVQAQSGGVWLVGSAVVLAWFLADRAYRKFGPSFHFTRFCHRTFPLLALGIASVAVVADALSVGEVPLFDLLTVYLLLGLGRALCFGCGLGLAFSVCIFVPTLLGVLLKALWAHPRRKTNFRPKPGSRRR